VTGPTWWSERRYGMRVHANIATVASFSPIGERADWYWSHLGSDPLVSTAPHPSPMAEVLAYHRDRWSHVARYDDFVPFLSLHRFSAEELVDLATVAGMKYLVQTAKHRDGWCWWDAPGTTRTAVRLGPLRDVLAEVSSACRRRGVLFGTSYSTIDWSDPRCPGADFSTEIVHPQVLDLIERYGSQMLWTDGADLPINDSIWRTAELIERARDLADAVGNELAIDDGWGASDPSCTTLARIPVDIHDQPWELRRSLGSSPGFNRAERAEHLLSTGELLDLLTEVIAKGGNLLIEVGLAVDGTVSELQQLPLRSVGGWVNQHLDIVHASRPFDQWGDAQVRYVLVGDELVAIDLAAGAEVVLAGLTPDRYEVHAVAADDGGAVHWEQHRGGVVISRIDRSPGGLAGVYRISLQPAAEAIRLFDDAVPEVVALQHLLDAATAGDIVQLHEARYAGPAEVPDGVIVRGLGWDRTSLRIDSGTADRTGVVRLGAGSTFENVHVSGEAVAGTLVECAGEGAVLAGCRIDGRVAVTSDDVVVRSVISTGVHVDAERVTIERCTLKGADRRDIGISITGGAGHRIVRNEIIDHLCALRCTDVSASVITENRLAAQWWGVHLQRCDHIEIADNQIQSTMRAIDVDGGNGSVVTGNWVADGDSGALVQFGATDTAVIDNHIERCRIGVLVWDAPATRIGPNTFVDIHEEDPCVFGPDADTDAA
jgi:alpha-L-fucosidase